MNQNVAYKEEEVNSNKMAVEAGKYRALKQAIDLGSVVAIYCCGGDYLNKITGEGGRVEEWGMVEMTFDPDDYEHLDFTSQLFGNDDSDDDFDPWYEFVVPFRHEFTGEGDVLEFQDESYDLMAIVANGNLDVNLPEMKFTVDGEWIPASEMKV
jgi:hypothetical protein